MWGCGDVRMWGCEDVGMWDVGIEQNRVCLHGYSRTCRQMTRQMQVLQLYYKIPFPLHDGGAISQYGSTLGLLSRSVSVDVLAMNQQRSLVDPALVPASFREDTSLQVVDVDNTIRITGALWHLITHQSYFAGRFQSAEFSQKLQSLLAEKRYDVIVLEHLYLCRYLPLLRRLSNARIVLRPQNVEHRIWERFVANQRNPFQRAYLSVETMKLKAFEIAMARQVDAIMPLSPKDAEWFQQVSPDVPVSVVPIGLDISRFPVEPGGSTSQPVVYHLGSMDWMPNTEGLMWFVREVLPLITARHPDIRITLAGKKMPEWFFARAGKNLEVSGMVPDARAFESGKEIMVVPLLSGSGTRVKIIEGMATGKAIVSTSVGAEGLGVTDGIHLLLADTPESFAGKVSECIASPELRKRLGIAARQLAEEKFCYHKTGELMATFLHTVTQRDTSEKHTGSHSGPSAATKVAKWVFDRVFAFTGLVVAAPVLLAVAMAIFFTDGRPVLFIQQRIGRHGKRFPLLKFRTMKPNDGSNTVSVRGDKRITRTGAFLRKYKLDELPGLWNVLVGHMSFVGPRPDVPGYADMLQGEDRLILNLRPGITGPATLKYANEEELLATVENPQQYNDKVIFPDKVKINLDYYYHHNLFTDIRILFRTLFRPKTTLSLPAEEKPNNNES